VSAPVSTVLSKKWVKTPIKREQLFPPRFFHHGPPEKGGFTALGKKQAKIPIKREQLFPPRFPP
jgi:hypothetical protein